jgi:GNAT superfamily N-acetyltransferase
MQTSSKPKWSIRRFQKTDLTGIAKLAETVYRGDALADTAYLEWKYLRNPLGEAMVAVCECEGQIIGAQALVPQPMKIGDEVYQCAWGCDLMIHPEFRRQGIFIALARFTFEWSKGIISIVYGTRGMRDPTIRGLFKYFNYMKPGRLIMLMKYLRPLSALRCIWIYEKVTSKNALRYLRELLELLTVTLSGTFTSSILRLAGGSKLPRKDEAIEVKEINAAIFGSEFDKLWEESKDGSPVMVVRSKEYLNWRYANPVGEYVAFRADKQGALRGYAALAYVMTGKMKAAWLFDLLASESDVASALLQQCMNRAKRDNAIVFKMWDMKVTRNYSRRLGLWPAWRSTPLSMHLDDANIPAEVVGKLSNWYVTAGDTEDWM